MARIRTLAVAGVVALAFAGLAFPAHAEEENANLTRRFDNGLVREVRVALVCYGGSSLAIYIHGNAKELHRLVLASKALQMDALDDNMKMQRNMADGVYTQMPPAGRYGSALTGSTRSWYDRLLSLWWHDPKKVRTRVVVDVIAGTSAGGINGVILSKALAHDLSQDSLTALWMDKADLRLLTHHYLGLLNVFRGKEPIDGDAMVGWLYDALDGMDREAKSALGTHSLLPDGDQLDLFVTTTDIKGYPQEVVVNDPPFVAEKHFPHVLHFIYSGHKRGCAPTQSSEIDDFCPAWTPALAFAARASSSIPGVFPSLNLDETLKKLERRAKQPIPGVESPPPIETVVRRQFRNYELQEPNGDITYVTKTYFVDGGVLDNHPFGPAIAQIKRRPNDQEVKRVLIYLQPDPGKPPVPADGRRPRLAGSIWAGLSTIPSNQPILNDLNDVLAYNEKVQRIADIVQSEEAAADARERENGAPDCHKPETLDAVYRFACEAGLDPQHMDEELMKADMSQLRSMREHVEDVADRGVTDLAGRSYYTLRVHSVLSQFAAVISSENACNYPPDSAHNALVMEIIDRWARGNGLIGKTDDPRAQKEKQQQFLADFDVGYQRRQLRFVTQWIDEQYAAQPSQNERRALDELKSAAARRIEELTRLVRGQASDAALAAQLKKLTGLFANLKPWEPVEGKSAALGAIADAFVAKNHDELDALRTSVGAALRGLQQEVRKESYDDFKTKGLGLPPKQRRQILVRYFGFPFWDRQIYPLVAFSDIGEFEPINVMRLSPDDATLLGGGSAQQKLVGATKAHFGAFLSREGRESDYVWGRLDAAERLLSMLQIPQEDRKPKELFQSIVDEVRRKEGKLIRESVLKDRESKISSANLAN